MTLSSPKGPRGGVRGRSDFGGHCLTQYPADRGFSVPKKRVGKGSRCDSLCGAVGQAGPGDGGAVALWPAPCVCSWFTCPCSGHFFKPRLKRVCVLGSVNGLVSSHGDDLPPPPWPWS